MNVSADLCETENVVNEEQHVLALCVTEVLSDCQTCRSTQSLSQYGRLTVSEIASMVLVCTANQRAEFRRVMPVLPMHRAMTAMVCIPKACHIQEAKQSLCIKPVTRYL